MPDLPKFSGFEVIEVLPTGDRRKVHEIFMDHGLEQTWVLVECNGYKVAKKSFVMGTDPTEMNTWLQTIMAGHKDNCPIEDEEVTNATDEGGG